MHSATKIMLTLVLILSGLGSLRAYESYQDYALRLIRKTPDGVKFRPDLESFLNELASRARSKRDRRPLQPNTMLLPAARAQAMEMLKGDFVGHESKSGYPFAKRFEAFANPGDHGRYGENAARDRQEGKTDKYKTRALFNQWLESRGHRNNLLYRGYKYVATGVVQQGHHIYAVQIFWEY